MSRTPAASKIVYALGAVTLASTTKEKGTSRTGQVEGRSQRAQLLAEALLPGGGSPSSLGNAELRPSQGQRARFSSFSFSLFSFSFLFFFFSEPEVNEDSFYSCSVVAFDSPKEIVEGNFCGSKVSNFKGNSLERGQVVIFLKRF